MVFSLYARRFMTKNVNYDLWIFFLQADPNSSDDVYFVLLVHGRTCFLIQFIFLIWTCLELEIDLTKKLLIKYFLLEASTSGSYDLKISLKYINSKSPKKKKRSHAIRLAK